MRYKIDPDCPDWEGEIKDFYVHAWYKIGLDYHNEPFADVFHVLVFDDDGKEISVNRDFLDEVSSTITEEWNYR